MGTEQEQEQEQEAQRGQDAVLIASRPQENHRMSRVAGHVHFDESRCKGCGLCVTVCPRHLIGIDITRFNIKGYHPALIRHEEQCTGCANCAMMCPETGITVERGVVAVMITA